MMSNDANRELVLDFLFGDKLSAREVRDLGQAIEYTGKHTEETAEKLNRLRNALADVGENLFLQKGAAADLAAALSSLEIERQITRWQRLSSAQDEAGKSLQQTISLQRSLAGSGSFLDASVTSGILPILLDSQLKGFGQAGWTDVGGSGSAAETVFENGLISSIESGMIAGHLGVMADSLIDVLTHKVSECEPEIPSFHLLWQTIDGQIERVAETWQNMGRDQRIVAAAEEVWQSQLDFVRKLALVAGGEDIPSFEFSLGGVGRSIEDILNQKTAQGLIKVAFGSYGQLSEVFGPAFQEEMKKVFMDTMGQNLGMFAFGQDRESFQKYMDWKFNQFTSMPAGQAMQEFENWMASQAIFSPVGRPGIRSSSIFDLFTSIYPDRDMNDATFSQLEQFAKTVIPGWFTRGEIALGSEDSQKPWNEFFNDLDQQVNGIFDLVTAGMGQAFAASLKTGEFQTFEQNFKQSILSSVQQSLIKGFAEQELLPIVFQPFYGTEERPAISDVLQKYLSGDLPLDQVQGYLTQMAGELTSTLNGFEPIWETLNTTFQELNQALGLNTTAVGQNTEAILGPVNNFLLSLDTGSLAPAESMAGLEGLKDELYANALADPAAFSTYANFMTSHYLPWLQGVSTDYGAEIAGVRTGVEIMPWVQDARGYTPIPGAEGGGGAQLAGEGNASGNLAQDIGQEVGRALGPMLLDLKESGQITIDIIVDGQIIRQKVIESLDDPAVVQRVRARIF
ncbi:MAG: hypothetical protein AB1847_11355 [bacterium]